MGLEVGIEQILVEPRSVFADRTLSELQIRRETGVIVLAIRRAGGEMLFNPPADAKINGGDHLIAMGEPQNLRRLEQALTGVAA